MTTKQMSVLSDTKCQGVQTLLVIGMTVTLVTSWWARDFLFSPPSVVQSSQQLDAISPAFPLPPFTEKAEAALRAQMRAVAAARRSGRW
jgi:hypothetical protein